MQDAVKSDVFSEFVDTWSRYDGTHGSLKKQIDKPRLQAFGQLLRVWLADAIPANRGAAAEPDDIWVSGIATGQKNATSERVCLLCVSAPIEISHLLGRGRLRPRVAIHVGTPDQPKRATFSWSVRLPDKPNSNCGLGAMSELVDAWPHKQAIEKMFEGEFTFQRFRAEGGTNLEGGNYGYRGGVRLETFTTDSTVEDWQAAVANCTQRTLDALDRLDESQALAEQLTQALRATYKQAYFDPPQPDPPPENGIAPAPRPDRNTGATGPSTSDLNEIFYGPPGTGKTRKAWEDLKTIGDKGDLKAKDRIKFVTFHPSYSYEDFVIGMRPEPDKNSTAGITYKTIDGVFKKLCDQAFRNPDADFHLIIDEMNRGNLSRIFGELMTLLEPDKRAVHLPSDGELPEGWELIDAKHLPKEDGNGRKAPADTWYRTPTTIGVTLPFAEKDTQFFVPDNLHVVGTMNTADRSIAMMDFALRRRFTFTWIGPDFSADFQKKAIAPKLAEDASDDAKAEVERACAMFAHLNQGITALKGRDYTIGHSYLMKAIGGCREQSEVEANINGCLQHNVIPLLAEYFYEDWDALRALLGEKLVVEGEGDWRGDDHDPWFRLADICVDAKARTTVYKILKNQPKRPST